MFRLKQNIGTCFEPASGIELERCSASSTSSTGSPAGLLPLRPASAPWHDAAGRPWRSSSRPPRVAVGGPHRPGHLGDPDRGGAAGVTLCRGQPPNRVLPVHQPRHGNRRAIQGTNGRSRKQTGDLGNGIPQARSVALGGGRAAGGGDLPAPASRATRGTRSGRREQHESRDFERSFAGPRPWPVPWRRNAPSSAGRIRKHTSAGPALAWASTAGPSSTTTAFPTRACPPQQLMSNTARFPGAGSKDRERPASPHTAS